MPGPLRYPGPRLAASTPAASPRRSGDVSRPMLGPDQPVSARDVALLQPRFPARSAFHATIKRRVAQYFADSRQAPTGDWRLFVQTGVILAWLAAAYALLVFVPMSLLGTMLAVLALAQGLALVGLNIMHSGAHESYSPNKTINWLMGGTLNMLGCSQRLWRHKHNRLHHIYTNIHTFDNDLQTSGLLRFSPAQPWRPWHRWQHLYAFAVYSLLTLTWVTVGDCRKLIMGRIGPYLLPPPSVLDIGVFVMTKLGYFGYALILPGFFHPWQHVLLAFVAVHLILGLTLSLTFQLAHTVERTSFPTPDAHTGMMPRGWAEHEVATTADFAPHNAVATWYLGGLNFQIEHHLFPKISHIHYPAISTIVAATCQEFALPYICYPTVRAAIRGHYGFLKTLARRPPP